MDLSSVLWKETKSNSPCGSVSHVVLLYKIEFKISSTVCVSDFFPCSVGCDILNPILSGKIDFDRSKIPIKLEFFNYAFGGNMVSKGLIGNW